MTKKLEYPQASYCMYCRAQVHYCTCCIIDIKKGFEGSRLGVYSFDSPFRFNHSCPNNEGKNHMLQCEAKITYGKYTVRCLLGEGHEGLHQSRDPDTRDTIEWLVEDEPR